MVPRGKGTILFTGATASMRGGPGFAAFASAKFGLRAVAQSMARELGPKNIHVAHLVIDGGVDSEAIRKRIVDDGATPRPDSPEDYAAEIARDRVLWGGIVRKLGLRVE